MKHYIAVYGTLKKGFHNHDLLRKANFVKKSHSGPGYALFVNRLPFLVKREDGLGCEIEIYQVDDKTLEELDQLEGHPHFYHRQTLRYEDDSQIQIYVLTRPDYLEWFLKETIDKAKESYEG